MALGRPSQSATRGWISHSGYSLTLQGDAQVQRLLQVARTFGIPVPALAADGAAKVDLQVAGNWPGFKAPSTTGRVQLHSIRTPVAGLNAPLEIASADVSLEPDEIKVQNLTASLAGSVWRGALSIARQCALPGHCPVHFDLHADEIATDRLAQILNPQPGERAWYQFTSSSSPGIPYLRTLHAAGKLAADRLVIHTLVVTGVSANTELEDGKLRLSELRGNLLGGRHVGEWKADFSVKPPKYAGSGTLESAVLEQLADAMHDGWISGTANAKYGFRLEHPRLAYVRGRQFANRSARCPLAAHLTRERQFFAGSSLRRTVYCPRRESGNPEWQDRDRQRQLPGQWQCGFQSQFRSETFP
jgi:hypothetical protein